MTLNSPNTSGHLIDLDTPSGQEFIFGASVDTLLSDVDFWVKYAQEKKLEYLYNQLEFVDEFGKCMCTIYGPMTVLSIILGRELTKEERHELCVLRFNQKDFDINVGGFVTVGVDVARKWYNSKFPEDPIVTMLVVNTTDTRIKFLQKQLPLVRSFRGNRQYTVDAVDGTLDKLDYFNYPTTYGHCTGIIGLEIPDNYKYKYRYKSIDDFKLLVSRAIEGRNSYAFFKLSQLNESGQRQIKAMQMKLWNGERAEDPITRFEASIISMRIAPTLKSKDIWNGKNPGAEVSKYELSVMFNRATGGNYPIYTGTDRNKTSIKRGDAIVELMKYI